MLPSENKTLYTALDVMLDGVSICTSVRDREGEIVDFTVVYVNDAAARINRRSKEDHINNSLKEIVPGIVENGMLERYKEVVEMEVPLVMEDSYYFYGIHDQGEERYFDIQAVPFGDGFLSTWRETTEKHIKEDAEKYQEELLRDFIDFQKNLFLLNRNTIMEQTADFLKRYCEHIAIILLSGGGGEEADIYIYSQGTRFTDRRQISAMEGSQVLEVMENRKAAYNISVSEQNKRFPFDRKMNEKYGIRSSYIVPIVTEDLVMGVISIASSRALGFSEILRGIVSILASGFALSLKGTQVYEKALESESKYKTLFEYAPDAILLFDTQKGVFLEVNQKAQELLNMETSRIRGLTPEEVFFPPGSLNQLEERAFSGDEQSVIELYIKNSQEDLVPCDARAAVFPGEKERILRISLMDVTMRIEAEREKKRNEEMVVQSAKLSALGELSAGIAHEIAQPLSGIRMVAENLLFESMEGGNEGKIDGEYLTEKSEDVIKYVRRISNIIEHIRIFSRDQRGSMDEYFDINRGIENALSLVRTQYTNKQIQILLNLSEDIPKIYGNIYRFEQVVLNLLSNAKDALLAVPVGERNIEIATGVEEEQLVVQVIDNGCGIPGDVFNRIFEPFFTTKITNQGTGLGLSVTYGIVKGMMGDISIRSNEGEGTTVTVSFPLTI
jgi:PAS domain S-box-containing protein